MKTKKNYLPGMLGVVDGSVVDELHSWMVGIAVEGDKEMFTKEKMKILFSFLSYCHANNHKSILNLD